MRPLQAAPARAAEHAAGTLRDRGVRPTRARVLVLAHLLAQHEARSPREIHAALGGEAAVNRVTLYRILDLLVEQGLAARTSAADRSYRYCCGRSAQRLCHFHCLRCGQALCLDLASLSLAAAEMTRRLGARVERIEVRVDGVCAACGPGRA